jgi:hypothetical protein
LIGRFLPGVRIAPVSSVDGCVRITDRARHPSGSSIGEARALAAWQAKKNENAVRVAGLKKR